MGASCITKGGMGRAKNYKKFAAYEPHGFSLRARG
jgi:hypothetical protein